MTESSNRTRRAEGLASFFESLEDRTLLSAPTFGTALNDAYWVPSSGGGRTIGVDGYDQDGDSLTLTAVSDNPKLSIVVAPNTDHFARLHFVLPNLTGGGTTPIGDILVQLFEDGPSQATQRFITLATNHVNADKSLDPNGVPFYDNVLVHRVIPGFMIQTGDAQNGNGTGGSPLDNFPDAFDPKLAFAGPGVLAMANSGPNTNDSQFFITDAPTQWLNNKHIIFGQVVSGMNVLEQIINVQRDTNTNRPYNPPVLDYVQITTSPQDGTFTMVAQPGLTGAAHVTVKLDDGHGGIVQKVITVRSMADLGENRPAITQPADLRLAPGQTATFTANITDDGILPLTLSAQSDNTGATVSVNEATKQVTVTAPQNFSGMMKIVLSSYEAGGWSDLEPGQQVAYVLVEGPVDPPVYKRIAPSVNGATAASTQVGSTLYVAEGAAGLSIYDVSNPSNPVKLNTVALGGWARDVKVVNGVAYVADTQGNDGKGLIVTVDVSNPAAPHVMDTLSLPSGTDGQGNALTGIAVTLAISGNTAWVADYVAGVIGVNITDPSNLSVLTAIKQPSTSVSIGAAVGVAVKDQYLYVSDAAGIVLVFNVSTPSSPQIVGAFGQGLHPWGIDIYGNVLYMADQNSLVSWSLTNPIAPKKLGQLAMTNSWLVNVEGPVALVSRDTGFSFVDVNNPAKMTQTYKYTAQEFNYSYMGYTGMPSISGKIISLPLGANGLMVLEADTTVAKSYTFYDSHGVKVTFSISKGMASLHTTGAGQGDLTEVEISGSSATSVTITTVGGTTTIGDVVVAGGSLKSFTGKTTDLIGDFSVDGVIGTLTLNNLLAGSNVAVNNLSSLPTLTTMSFNQVNESSIDSNSPIKSLKVNGWTDNPATVDAISAPWIGSISSKGNLPVPLELSGVGMPAKTLSSAKISGTLAGDWKIAGNVGSVSAAGTAGWALEGNGGALGTVSSLSLGDASGINIVAPGAVFSKISAKRLNGGGISAGSIGSMSVTGATGIAGDATFELSAAAVKSMSVKGNLHASLVLTQAYDSAAPKISALGKLTVGGLMDATTISSAGNIGSVTAKLMHDSTIFAGVKNSVLQLPSARADFLAIDDSLLPTIGSVKVTGLLGQLSYDNTNISAWTIKSVSIKDVQTANGNTKFGLAGHSVTTAAVAGGDFEIRLI